MEYPGGVEEWFSNESLFEDANETEQGEEQGEEQDEEQDEEQEGLSDTELDEKEEFQVDGITYIRKLDDSNEVLTADTHDVVGKYDGKGIVWASKKTYKAHKQKIKAKAPKRGNSSIHQTKKTKKKTRRF